jgi:hypothetical protein
VGAPGTPPPPPLYYAAWRAVIDGDDATGARRLAAGLLGLPPSLADADHNTDGCARLLTRHAFHRAARRFHPDRAPDATHWFVLAVDCRRLLLS